MPLVVSGVLKPELVVVWELAHEDTRLDTLQPSFPTQAEEAPRVHGRRLPVHGSVPHLREVEGNSHVRELLAVLGNMVRLDWCKEGLSAIGPGVCGHT